MKITWLGHAAFLIEGSKKVLIDPFISGNPVAPVKPEDLEADVILVTHGHNDHLGDAVEIASRCGAPIICIYELSVFLGDKGVETIGMNIGGTLKLDDNLKITMVKAVHSADVVENKIISAGEPVGFTLSSNFNVPPMFIPIVSTPLSPRKTDSSYIQIIGASHLLAISTASPK